MTPYHAFHTSEELCKLKESLFNFKFEDLKKLDCLCILAMLLESLQHNQFDQNLSPVTGPSIIMYSSDRGEQPIGGRRCI
jgi:hypothetical protein